MTTAPLTAPQSPYPLMPDLRQALIDRLDLTCALVRTSEEARFSAATSERALEALRQVRRQIEEAGAVDQLKLVLLYAPTGVLQEIALDNDWAPQYLKLAGEVERLLAEMKGPR